MQIDINYNTIEQSEKLLYNKCSLTLLPLGYIMNYCLYNAIKTPDGTILWCQSGHDYKTHTDSVSSEEYMNDGTGYGVRRSVNKVSAENLSIGTNDPFEKVRTAKFWGSYGKDGKGEKRIMALEEMEDSHIRAILDTQKIDIIIKELFEKEILYRIENFKKELDTELPTNKKTDNKPKV